ncbi:cilia- and flagella-associated protein 251 [Xylocopa sonorina]|uniref:cilia- and flagella-associated protein 251 n=1 Tax=Xylocopa sonorina TaxID=1818115 RepID=UPI00403AF13E
MATTNYVSPNSSSKESTDSRNEENESNLCPFKLLWSFGINSEVPLINLNTRNRTIIAYACSHFVIIYNYDTQEATPLQGHKNAVRTLSTSRDGKWLLSADFEEDCVVVVWDTENGTSICTLFNPHGDKEMTAAKISPNAKYIVTVGNEIHQKVQFWLWTYGEDKPNAIVELTEINLDRIKDITFNEDSSNEFALTADYSVAFFKWEQDELKYYIPKILGNARRYGTFNCSCYIPKTQRVLTATINGYVLVWGLERKQHKGKNQITVNSMEKKHLKSAALEKSSIMVILCHNGLIVTGTSKGRINFYDYNLKILYWCQHEYLDSIRSISFDLPSTLVGPVPAVSETNSEYDEENDFEYEETEQYWETKFKDSACKEKIKSMQKLDSIKYCDNISSTITVNLEVMFRSRNKNQQVYTKPPHVPTDATLQNAPFFVENFFVSCASGTIALIEIPVLKCRIIFKNVNSSITSLDAHPRSNYIVTGNAGGFVCLYDYEKRKFVVCKKTPPLPDCTLLLDDQVKSGNIIYITCPESHEKLTAITLLKYSPMADLIACGLENGTLWMLHPFTLEPLDTNPYKHSTESILKLTFTECGEYMAYADNTLVVAVFKRNPDQSNGSHLWDFLGKYRSHYATIRDVLFGPATSDSVVYRLFSLGEDQNLIEYSLKDSGPYPYPGLIIIDSYKIECEATPLSFAWYPRLGPETFLIISNSQYKYRLINDLTKTIRGTFVGPLYGAPVRLFKVLPDMEQKDNKYMVFATNEEIGLQILPLDGNPYKSLGIIGHPRKITNICVSYDGNILFTSGYNDQCVLMWKIKCRAVDVLARLGGKGLTPYYSLIEGGGKGWLISEMKDLFYYAQILHQGENITAPRVISDIVSTKEIPNLMRAIGYYPSNEEIEILMGEISYRDYAETGHLVEEIKFEDFVKLYINHRPAFGISLNQIQEAFNTFANSNEITNLQLENPALTRDDFIRILFGESPNGFTKSDGLPFGEPLTIHEAFMYMKILTGVDENLDEIFAQDKESAAIDFSFLPERISYKDFTADIMGIELPAETRADDD